jgi:hypothetical protein
VSGSDVINVERRTLKWVLGPWPKSSSYVENACDIAASNYVKSPIAERHGLAVVSISVFPPTQSDI